MNGEGDFTRMLMQTYVQRTPREFQPSRRFIALDDDDDPSGVS